MSKKPTNPISKDVLEQIKGGKVHMHHDWYFALLATGFGAAVAFTLVVAIYAINLSILRLQIAQQGFQPGLLGWYYMYVARWPFIYLLLAALAVTGVVYLLRQRSQYARNLPSWSIALGIIIFVICLGSVVARSSINRGLWHSPLRPLYEERMFKPMPSARFNERNQAPVL